MKQINVEIEQLDFELLDAELLDNNFLLHPQKNNNSLKRISSVKEL